MSGVTNSIINKNQYIKGKKHKQLYILCNISKINVLILIIF